ncbi:MAG: catalase [Actinomycetota bacterium]|nr:catalase [Actinomycetota bacterium]
MTQAQPRNAPGNLTTRQGHPVENNQSSRTIGARGPATLENYHLIEKISHFDRERIPERVVHARGFLAHGEFEPTGMCGDEPMSTYSRAKVFTQGTKTPVSLRFSTVIGGRDSSEAARDPRGFAIKFCTEEGNWDLVGNNLQVFFIRDAIKFPDVIHSLKPDPVTFRQEPNRIFDFMSLTPEAMHMLTFLFSTWGIPKDYMHVRGSAVNTYKLVNADGKAVLCKFHFLPRQGEVNLTQAEANEIQATELGHASKATYEAIEAGQFPQWDVYVQVMEDGEHPELDFDPLDDTKYWPRDQFEYRHIGVITLTKNVEDFHNENEQSAFGTGVLVDGLDFSDDKMLIGRTFSYSDTQRYRVGPNYLQLPVNAPRARPNTNQGGGQMSFYRDGTGENPHINFEPSWNGGLTEAPTGGNWDHPLYNAEKTKATLPKENNYGQARRTYQEFGQRDKDELRNNMIDLLGSCDMPIRQRMVGHWLRVDEGLGTAIAQGIGVDLDDARKAVEEVDRYWAERGRPNAGALPEAFAPA